METLKKTFGNSVLCRKYIIKKVIGMIVVKRLTVR